MLHIGNGGGSVLIRFNRPTDLANFLTKIIKYLRSNKLNEDFEHLEFIAEKIKDGDEVAYDKQFIEM